MRRLILSVCGLMLLVGCQGRSEKTAGQGKAVLPPEVAGVWQAQDSPWKIVLAPDGTVASALVPMGEAEVRPNETTKFEMQDGSFSHITAGECFVEYQPEGRQLIVGIELKDIHISFPDDALDGNSIDWFAGPVSEDGRFWTADRINVFDYGPRFPQDENDINNPEPLIFEKVADYNEPNNPDKPG